MEQNWQRIGNKGKLMGLLGQAASSNASEGEEEEEEEEANS